MAKQHAGAVAASPRLRVWDGVTRVVHWSLVALFAFSWGSAEYHRMDYHRYSGYALLGVLVFRVYWGWVGSSTARFTHFVKGPRTIWRYLRSSLDPAPGHNPLGALSVLALLGLLLAQVGLGLFSVDVDGLESGPLSRWVSFETGRLCATAHALVFNILLGAVALHIAAIFFYWLVKRDNLIRPMITGWKTWTHQPPPAIAFASKWVALLGIVFAAGVVWLIAGDAVF